MRQNGQRSNVRFPYGSEGMKKGGRVGLEDGGFLSGLKNKMKELSIKEVKDYIVKNKLLNKVE